jgi:hypothetical protein
MGTIIGEVIAEFTELPSAYPELGTKWPAFSEEFDGIAPIFGILQLPRIGHASCHPWLKYHRK